jgi:hypothetical protein
VPQSPLFRPSVPFVGALGHGVPVVDRLELLHRRMGHTAHDILKEAVRNSVVTGVALERWQFNAKESKKRHQGVCDICAKTKITRASFPRNPHRLDNLSPGDVIIFLNTTSLEGYKYVLLLMDQASK